MNKVHLLCDEASTLGKMDQIAQALTIGRSYGLKLQLYYHDIGQLKKCWPDGADQTLLANSALKRLGVQGQMELASAMFNGNAFVPYGPGQYTPTPTPEQAAEHGLPAEAMKQPEIEQNRGGMGM